MSVCKFRFNNITIQRCPVTDTRKIMNILCNQKRNKHTFRYTSWFLLPDVGRHINQRFALDSPFFSALTFSWCITRVTAFAAIDILGRCLTSVITRFRFPRNSSEFWVALSKTNKLYCQKITTEPSDLKF